MVGNCCAVSSGGSRNEYWLLLFLHDAVYHCTCFGAYWIFWVWADCNGVNGGTCWRCKWRGLGFKPTERPLYIGEWRRYQRFCIRKSCVKMRTSLVRLQDDSSIWFYRATAIVLIRCSLCTVVLISLLQWNIVWFCPHLLFHSILHGIDTLLLYLT